MGVLPFRGTSTAWKTRTDKDLMKLSTGKFKVTHLGRHNPRHLDRLPARKQLCREDLGGTGGQQIKHELSLCSCNKEGWPTASWAASGRLLPVG